MATFRSKTDAFATGNTALSINVPAGVVDGDLLILAVQHVTSSVPTITDPAGWTTDAAPTDIGFIISCIGASARTRLYWRIASGEPASYSVTVGGTIPNGTSGVMLAYSSANATQPDAATTIAQATSTNPDSPSITSVTDQSLILSIFLAMNATIATVTPTGHTVRENAVVQTSYVIGVSELLVTPAGASNPTAWTIGDSSLEVAIWQAFSFLIRLGGPVLPTVANYERGVM